MLLKAQELKKIYNGKSVVNSLTFHVDEAEIVGLLGPNGAGKTTAFYITMGLIKPDSGKILFLEKDITTLPIHKRAKLGMSYLAQEPSVFRDMSVEQNLRCVLELTNYREKEKKERMEELLEELKLASHRKKKARTLSGGERRRLEIARALILNPKLLLLDEPFANIDPITISDVQSMILSLKKKNISVLITDHNARELTSIVDRSYLIQDGRVSMSGTLEELLSSQQARQSYFGERFQL